MMQSLDLLATWEMGFRECAENLFNIANYCSVVDIAFEPTQGES
jgi:hypothetical protein